MLPYTYTSNESLSDAAATAEALHIRYDIMPIHAAVEGLTDSLEKVFAGTTPDATEENLQSRARGTMLMAISNKFGPIVLTTGNKSEVSVGYATLYGDMNGGFNPIKDLYKTPSLRAGPLPQCGTAQRLPRARRRRHPGERDRPRRRPPSSSPASAIRTRCRLTTCSTTF